MAADITSVEDDPVSALAQQSLTPGNRFAVWVVLLGGTGIAVDMCYRLYSAEGYQWVRHTAGLAGIAWAVLTIVRVTRRSEVLLILATDVLLAKHAPEHWGAAEHDRFKRDLPYFCLALICTLLGMRAMLYWFRRALLRARRSLDGVA